PAHPGQTRALGGALATTTGAGVVNRISISSATGGAVSVVVDGVTTTYPNTVSRVVLYGQGGDDTIQVTGSLSLPVEIYGGAGSDKLKGGGGNDILVGGDGDDMLVSGTGRNFLVGGAGADKVVGDTDDDILIGGSYGDPRRRQ